MMLDMFSLGPDCTNVCISFCPSQRLSLLFYTFKKKKIKCRFHEIILTLHFLIIRLSVCMALHLSVLLTENLFRQLIILSTQ